ncbi:Lrp/AsnC family transcriptional regulator [Leucobacter allii]|uniref:Lrp/AsnC family transcriptional regulator n=1 Tax=Leucobacter allii TaxID=2932247 RepID=UPI001FD240C5|nr:Lrp/AsnC family transcriptional regulator [Leucobacter allii]UOR01641.1 Lrp/AsnC family transcriptional regulator [Leucobacter allii]
MTEVLSALDRRIVGALQMDGRAPWSVVAKALDEPLRTVARRGRDLVDSGAARVVALPNLGPTCVIEITCLPARIDSLARELAQHPGVVFALVLANPSRLLVEVHEQSFDLATMTLEVIPGFAGVAEVSAAPVLRYWKTNADWRPGLLTAAEAGRLEAAARPEESTAAPEPLDGADRAIVDALVTDGRTAVAELAAAAGVTEPTARRRLADLRERGAFAIRTLVDPAALGYGVEAWLRIDCSPQHADRVGEALAAQPESRYVAQVLGEYALVAQLSARDLPHVRELLSRGWIREVRGLRSSLVTRAHKRSGYLTRAI